MNIVVAYRGIPQARGYAFGACLARALRRLGHQVVDYGNYYQSKESVGASVLPPGADALIYCECNDADGQYWELRTFNAPIKAYWDFDVDTHPGSTFSFVERMGFTHLFFANNRYKAAFSCLNPGATYLPIAFDDELFRPNPLVAKTVDVGLCGTAYPSRITLIKHLTQSGIAAQLISGVYGDHYVQTINRFRIHLNYDVGGGRGLMPARVWETLGSRTLLLAEKADFIEHFFSDMQEVVLYSTPDECADKIRLLFQQPTRIEKIAAQGYQRAVSEHTYLRRAETMLAAFAANRQRPKERPAANLRLRVRLLILRHRFSAAKHALKNLC